jgi:hypothetical protein
VHIYKEFSGCGRIILKKEVSGYGQGNDYSEFHLESFIFISVFFIYDNSKSTEGMWIIAAYVQ